MIMMYVVFGGVARSSAPLDGVRCGAGGTGSGQVLDGGWIAGGLGGCWCERGSGDRTAREVRREGETGFGVSIDRSVISGQSESRDTLPRRYRPPSGVYEARASKKI
jgi:hypothetical protein